jgi:hypothetical protein
MAARQTSARRRTRAEPVEYKAARAGEKIGRDSATANQQAAARTADTMRGHPSMAERRFRATGTTTGSDAAPAHAAGLFGETPPVSETPLAGGRGRQPGPGAGRRAGRRQASGANPDQRPKFVQGTGNAIQRQFRATSRVLVVEFLACLVIIAVKPTEPAPAAQATGAAGAFESTIPQVVAIMIVFMLLAGLGAAGPNPQRVANLFGGLITVVLLFKNHGAISASITPIVGAKSQPGVPNAPAASPSNG